MFQESRLRPVLETGRRTVRRLIVVSNREPFVHERRGDRIVCTQPAGGVTAALDPLLCRAGGVWVAQGDGAADREVVDRHSRIGVPPDRPAYLLRRVWVPERLRREYYGGLANRALWPLCHNVFQRPRFRAREWDAYRKVNEMFADAVLEEAAGEPAIVFIQDYHFALLARMLRNRDPELAIAHFWHIPWPTPEIFFGFPWSRELLDGLLGNDLLGFHLRRHGANFLRCAGRDETVVDYDRGRVFGETNDTTVRPFPIGIDFAGHCERAGGEKTQAAWEAWQQRIGPGVRVGIGIDRMDYTKGIPERIRALDLFFERHPEWRRKLVFVQVGVPSRSEIPEYRSLAEEIANLVAAVNGRWGAPGWQPIQFIHENLPPEPLIALHRLADFCLVTPLHDGMNLVAKEFVASRADLDGVLVLSRFAGASVELSSAVLVNPFSERDIEDGIFAALNMPPAERRTRMSRMRSIVQSNDVFHWASGILSALEQVTFAGGRIPAPATARSVRAAGQGVPIL